MHDLQSTIWAGHFETFMANPGDQTVVILPCADHRLDYFNNQFVKNTKSLLIEYICNYMSKDQIYAKLKKHWGYEHGLNEYTPRWIIREWFSFFITDIWEHGYNYDRYFHVNSLVSIDTNDLFNNYQSSLIKIFDRLELKFRVDYPVIQKQHENFVKNQKFHCIQKKCDIWCEQIINNDETGSMLNLTIFDEAYIQHKLRILGYEIKCDNLNKFPTLLCEMHKLIYKA